MGVVVALSHACRPSAFLSEEMLRRVRPRWKSDTVAVLMRILFVAFLLRGLTFNRESGFLVLIVPLVAIFWLALVRHRCCCRRTQILWPRFRHAGQGWAFAAWFVTT
jgi:hypothetical protein